MKKIVLLIFSLFFFNVILAQNHTLKITNSNTNKQVVIKQNSRIKLKTNAGQKLKGHFSVVDTNTIIIDDIRIDLADINELKRISLLVSVLAPVLFFSVGVVPTYASIIIGISAEPIALLALVPAAAMLYIAINPSSFSKKYKIDKGWTLETIVLPTQ